MTANVGCVLQVEQSVLKKAFHTLCCRLNKVVAKLAKRYPVVGFLLFLGQKKGLAKRQSLVLKV